MKNLSIYILIILIFTSFTDRISEIDSLKNIVDSQTDSVKAVTLTRLSYLTATSEPSLALECIDEAIRISEKLKDSTSLSKAYNRKGVIFFYLGDIEKSISYYFKSLRINKRQGNIKELAADYNNLAIAFQAMKNYKEALSYYNKSLELNKKEKDWLGVGLNYNNIGIVYRHLKEYNKALEYYHESLSMNKKHNYKNSIASNYNNIGNIYRDTKEYNKALDFYKKALSLAKSQHNKIREITITNNIGRINTSLKNKEEAFYYLSLARNANKELGSKTLEENNINALIDYYNMIRDFEKANKLYSRFINLKDSLNNNEKNNQINKLKTLYEIEQKDKEIENLRAQNIFSQKRLKDDRLLRNTLIISAVFLLLIILLGARLMIVRLEQTKKLEKLIWKRTKELEEAKIKAEESDKLKTTFLANISHEVRTPMNAISGYANMLENDKIDQDQKLEFISEISKGTANLLKTFENITHLARLENEDVIVESTECYLKPFMQNIYNKGIQFKNQQNKENVVLNLQIPSNGTGKIYTDNLLLKQVLNNLVDNAIKFTDQGEVNIGYRELEDAFTFFVEDTGIGVNPEFRSEIFKKFRKYSDSEDRIYDGAGLGLSIVKGNIDLLGGEIKFTSTPEKGSHFSFSLRK